MAIAVIDRVPENQKSISKRELLRNDIREAIDNKISCFEFVGDYNYKYLGSYAKEEAKYIIRSMVRKAFEKRKALDDCTLYVYLDDFNVAELFYKISIRKQEDRKHVYMNLYLNDFDKIMDGVYETAKKEAIEWGNKKNVTSKN